MPSYPDLAGYIGGEWQRGRENLPVHNPTDESPIGAMPVTSREDLDTALTATEDGFRIWRS